MEVSEEELSVKPKTTKPRVIATEPDRTLERYIVDEFKAKAVGSKEVPFESIDLTLYKPKAKLVGFGTSEERLQFWVQAVIDRYIDNVSKEDDCTVQWEEIECYWEPEKPDKIRLIVKRKEEKLFVLTLFITTGRIQAQGVFYEQWASEEFPVLLQMVNTFEASNIPEPSLSQSKLFENKQDLTTLTEEKAETESSDEDDSDDEDDGEDSISSVSDMRLNSLNESFANIESDVTKFKANIEKELYRINCNVDDLLIMKDKVVKIENGNKAWVASVDDKLYQSKCDFTSTHEIVHDLTCQVKKLQDHKHQMATKQTEMKNDITELKQENKELKNELFLLREIIAKHENIIESDLKLKPINTSSDDSKIKPTTQAENQSSTRKITQSQPPKETSNNTIQSNDPNNNSLLILCDSNGKFIKTDLLCPDIKVEIHKSFTTNQAMNELQNSNANHKTVLLHCGTNDLEKMEPASLIQESKKLIQSSLDKYPGSRIIYSSLLPRQDLLQINVMEVNKAMEQYCKYNTKVDFLNNSHINKPFQFHDAKHLNQRGFRFFAKNLKSAIYQTTTRKTKDPRNMTSSPTVFPRQHPSPPSPSRPVNFQHQPTRYENTHIPRQPHLQNGPPTYANVTADRPFQPAQSNTPLMNNIMNTSLPVSLKSIIQQLQMFVS